MASTILDDAVTLAQMNCLAIIQLKSHLSSDNYSVVDTIRRMHAWRVALKMRCHARNLPVQFR